MQRDQIPSRRQESRQPTLPARVCRAGGLVRLASRLGLLVLLLVLLAGVRLLDRKITNFELGQGPAAPRAGLAAGAGERLSATASPMIPLPGQRHRFIQVSVTGYSSSPDQTDDTPFLTATLQRTRPGTLALSRDLLRTFTHGAPFDFGDRVLIPGMGIYVVEDTMHPRWRKTADIWFHDTETARRWGRRQIFLTRVDSDEPRLVALQWHPADAS